MNRMYVINEEIKRVSNSFYQMNYVATAFHIANI